PPSLPIEIPSLLPTTPFNAANEAFENDASDASFIRVGGEHNVPRSFDAPDSANAAIALGNAPAGAHIEDGGHGTPSGAENALDGLEPSGEGLDDGDRPVGTVRDRGKLSKEKLARKKVTTMVNREKRQAADQDALEMRVKWDEGRAAYNMKHNFAADYIHPSFAMGPPVISKRSASASNALNSRASEYFNRDRPRGQKLKMPAVIAMMKAHPEWSTKASEMDEAEQEELRNELNRKREHADKALRPTRLSQSRTLDILLKKIDADLHRIEDQTDSMFFMMTAKRVHDSSVKSGITGSEEVYNFFQDQYNLDAFDILRDFQLYALRKRGVSGESHDKLRETAVKIIRSSMSSILKAGVQIAMRYISYDVDIVEKHHIKIIGWPTQDVRFVKPADMTPQELRKIIKAFKTGAAYWRPLTNREKKKVEDDARQREEAGILAKRQRAIRSDRGRTHKRKSAGDKENGPARKRARGDNSGEGSSTGKFKSAETIGSDEDDDDEEEVSNKQ
ncbi:hypothetical protein HWV62_42223, partial [Athelia sp. TMB]